MYEDDSTDLARADGEAVVVTTRSVPAVEAAAPRWWVGSARGVGKALIWWPGLALIWCAATQRITLSELLGLATGLTLLGLGDVACELLGSSRSRQTRNWSPSHDQRSTGAVQT